MPDRLLTTGSDRRQLANHRQSPDDRFRRGGGARRAIGGRPLRHESDRPGTLGRVIAPDGQRSYASAGRRNRYATIAITRSLSTPSPLVERSSHDVEANAAVERCRSRTGPAMRVRASRTHPSLPRRSRKSPEAGPATGLGIRALA